jgi:hypothetical protein
MKSLSHAIILAVGLVFSTNSNAADLREVSKVFQVTQKIYRKSKFVLSASYLNKSSEQRWPGEYATLWFFSKGSRNMKRVSQKRLPQLGPNQGHGVHFSVAGSSKFSRGHIYFQACWGNSTDTAHSESKCGPRTAIKVLELAGKPNDSGTAILLNKSGGASCRDEVSISSLRLATNRVLQNAVVNFGAHVSVKSAACADDLSVYFYRAPPNSNSSNPQNSDQLASVNVLGLKPRQKRLAAKKIRLARKGKRNFFTCVGGAGWNTKSQLRCSKSTPITVR